MKTFKQFDEELGGTTTASVPGAGDDSSTVVVKKKKKKVDFAKIVKRFTKAPK